MVNFRMFWKCMFSPTLYTIHRGTHMGPYDPNDWERLGDNLLTSVNFLWNLGVYSSPLLMYIMARKGYFTIEGVISLLKLSIGLTVIVGASYCIRSYGRLQNIRYQAFLSSLESLNQNVNENTKREIKRYDFDFYAWPVEFINRGGEEDANKPKGLRRWSKLVQSPCSIVGYLVLHSVGIRLIYPGSVKMLSYLLSVSLIESRRKLVERENGERFKIKTIDGNFIDTMFIDRRGNRLSGNGSTLVICSEGNAGFYEYGIMVTPLQAGYSVLGWNHPGFAGSTGMPYPEEEESAMDAVIQFGISLGFKPSQIVLFGWSIGGYTTAWAAMNYPEVKAVVLDATFDDLLPLAIPRMPASLEPIVKLTIRQYANLDIARHLVHYPGPIMLYRRSEDEVICIEPNVLSTNRGNHLLVKLLRHRFPMLFDQAAAESALADWLGATGSHQVAVYNSYGVSEAFCTQMFISYLENHERTFPMNIGENMDNDLKAKIALHLATRYMIDFHSTHCPALPARMFRVPSFETQI